MAQSMLAPECSHGHHAPTKAAGGKLRNMRTFNDKGGRRWQAALLEASYGYVLLTFNPFDGDGISQVQMDADTLAEADGLLRAYDEDKLQELLAKARPWDESTGIFTPSS